MKLTLKKTVAAVAFAAGAMALAGTAQAGAIISNGTLMLGVNSEGHLNTPYDSDPKGIGFMGLRFIPTGGASTEPGCQCEGWGVGIRSLGASGWASLDSGGIANLTVVSFTSDATSARSIVDVNGVTGAPLLRVVHDYHPLASTPYLYEVSVAIINTSGSDLAAGDLVYRRVMDWDISPTEFSEYVTIQGVPAVMGLAGGNNVYRTDNNGFNSANPFSFDAYGMTNVNFVDNGPKDHGALFDFEFGALAAGATRTFNTYYGAAPDEATADLARFMVNGDVSDEDIALYSYGQPSVAGGPDLGQPNTFIWGFGTKGTGVLTPVVPEPETYAMMLAGLGLMGAVARRRKQRQA